MIVNYRTPALALRCLDAMAGERETVPGLRAVLVDGGSGDGSAAALAAGLAERGCPDWAELLPLPVNGGFGYANNQALLRLAGQPMPPDYVCLVNPDAQPAPGALARLAQLLDRQPGAAAAGARLVDPDGVPQGSAFTFPRPRFELSRGASTALVGRLLGAPPVTLAPETASRVPWVTGAAVMLRLAALAEVGLFDDGFFLYFEEVELMHRLARAGWEVWHEPAALVEHVGAAATQVRWDATAGRRPAAMPAYWHRARRRYFARTAGRPAATLAALAFAAGRLVWRARVALERRPDLFPQRITRDTLRYGLWPATADAQPRRLPRLGDAPGALPAWMRSGAGGA